VKVIFSHGLPFSLAHGGLQTLIESLMRELALLGVEVEPERWWDADQAGDILHFVQRPNPGTVQLAKQKGRVTIMTEIIDEVASEIRFACEEVSQSLPECALPRVREVCKRRIAVAPLVLTWPCLV